MTDDKTPDGDREHIEYPNETYPAINVTSTGYLGSFNIFPKTDYAFTVTHFIVTVQERHDTSPEIVFELEYKDLQRLMDLMDKVDNLDTKADLILEKLEKLEAMK